MEIFFVGSKPWTANKLLCPVMISVNSLHDYATVPGVCSLVDSGAFTCVAGSGGYPFGSLPVYASKILKLNSSKTLGFVSQDYMCESFVLAKTGYTVAEHQRFTIYRYKSLIKILPKTIYVMPVLQGYSPFDYLSHIRMYNYLLLPGAWVGVGSVCKRNSRPFDVIPVLQAIKSERPDLKLHGFGLKKTALQNSLIRDLLFSSDSFAWAIDAYYKGKDSDSPVLASNYSFQIYDLIASSRIGGGVVEN